MQKSQTVNEAFVLLGAYLNVPEADSETTGERSRRIRDCSIKQARHVNKYIYIYEVSNPSTAYPTATE